MPLAVTTKVASPTTFHKPPIPVPKGREEVPAGSWGAAEGSGRSQRWWRSWNRQPVVMAGLLEAALRPEKFLVPVVELQ